MHAMNMPVNDHAHASAKAKFENYLRSQNVTLKMMFSVLDTNSDKAISITEFKNKCR